jgi:hypothetical protein
VNINVNMNSKTLHFFLILHYLIIFLLFLVVSYRCTNIAVQRQQHSPSASTLSLTPGRSRDLDQDMQALRLSRQDNPFIQVN